MPSVVIGARGEDDDEDSPVAAPPQPPVPSLRVLFVDDDATGWKKWLWAWAKINGYKMATTTADFDHTCMTWTDMAMYNRPPIEMFKRNLQMGERVFGGNWTPGRPGLELVTWPSGNALGWGALAWHQPFSKGRRSFQVIKIDKYHQYLWFIMVYWCLSWFMSAHMLYVNMA